MFSFCGLWRVLNSSACSKWKTPKVEELFIVIPNYFGGWFTLYRPWLWLWDGSVYVPLTKTMVFHHFPQQIALLKSFSAIFIARCCSVSRSCWVHLGHRRLPPHPYGATLAAPVQSWSASAAHHRREEGRQDSWDGLESRIWCHQWRMEYSP